MADGGYLFLGLAVTVLYMAMTNYQNNISDLQNQIRQAHTHNYGHNHNTQTSFTTLTNDQVSGIRGWL
jgi:cell division protein FtsL